AVHAAEQLHDLLIFEVREAEAAVFLRDLHAEGAELAQAVHHVLRIFAGGVDLDRVHLGADQLFERAVKRRELRALRRGQRVGMDQVETEIAEKHLLHEARPVPLLAGRLGDLAGFLLADVGVFLILGRHGVLPWGYETGRLGGGNAALRREFTRAATGIKRGICPNLAAERQNSPQRALLHPPPPGDERAAARKSDLRFDLPRLASERRPSPDEPAGSDALNVALDRAVRELLRREPGIVGRRREPREALSQGGIAGGGKAHRLRLALL